MSGIHDFDYYLFASRIVCLRLKAIQPSGGKNLTFLDARLYKQTTFPVKSLGHMIFYFFYIGGLTTSAFFPPQLGKVFDLLVGVKKIKSPLKTIGQVYPDNSGKSLQYHRL